METLFKVTESACESTDNAPELPRGAAALGKAKSFARVAAVDAASVGLLACEWAGLVAAYMLHKQGLLPGPLAALIGLAAMNLAFSVWHEGVHRSLARDLGINHLLGRLGAIPVLIPYQRLCTHHLLHHRHTNDPARDPDHWQLRGSFWTLALRYRAGEAEARRLYLAEKPSTTEIRGDRIQLGLTGLVGIGLFLLSPWSTIWVLVIPRALLIYVQGLYVNFLPHAFLPAGRTVSSRILPARAMLSWLMLRHHYHALHHAYPGIPWHRYPKAYAVLREDLAQRGVSTLAKGELWPLICSKIPASTRRVLAARDEAST